ncbi:MAG: universal stress protein [Planctomycetaceae bacterium]
MSVFHRKPVLVPIDYSEASLQAVRVAKSVAVSDADITVVYVAQDYDLTLHPLTWVGGPLPNYEEHRLLNGLRTWVEENNLGDVNLLVRKGDPGLKICEVAEEMSFKLIVVPSHGRHGVARFLLGSVAERIIRHCHCSVLVLHRTTIEPSTPQSADWLPRKRVVVPIDFSDASSVAIATALEVAESRDVIDVISVAPRVEEVAFYGVAPMPDDVRLENLRQGLAKYLTEHGYGSLCAHALIGDPGTAIVQYASDMGADLIVMPSQGLHGLRRLVLGSTTERVLRHSDIPVLVLRGMQEFVG